MNIEIKPRLGQGRTGIKCKKPQVTKNLDAATDKIQGILKIPAAQNVTKNTMDFPMHKQSINSSKTEAITQGTTRDINREIPFYPDLIYRLPRRPPANLQSPGIESKADTSPRKDLQFEENSPYQEGIIFKTYQRPDISYFQELKELENLVHMGGLVQKILPKQTDIDKILKIIQ